VNATVAPAPARQVAIPAPIPWEPPVTNATLPAREKAASDPWIGAASSP
jgi:hypothetical protein